MDSIKNKFALIFLIGFILKILINMIFLIRFQILLNLINENVFTVNFLHKRIGNMRTKKYRHYWIKDMALMINLFDCIHHTVQIYLKSRICMLLDNRNT